MFPCLRNRNRQDVAVTAAVEQQRHEATAIAELALLKSENAQLRQQLQHQWHALHQLMTDKTELKAKNSVFVEQNESLLATQKAAYKCVDRASKETDRYRNRAHRLLKQKHALQRRIDNVLSIGYHHHEDDGEKEDDAPAQAQEEAVATESDNSDSCNDEAPYCQSRD